MVSFRLASNLKVINISVNAVSGLNPGIFGDRSDLSVLKVSYNVGL